MIREQATGHTVRTWKALVALIRVRRSTGRRGTFVYGDLAEALFGARNRGAQSFGYPLGHISRSISELNRHDTTRHPYLNALVFDLEGAQAGIPHPQESDEIWSMIESRADEYLDRLGELLGYVEVAPIATASLQNGRSTDFSRITRNPAVMQGKACIRGMRVTVGMILGNLSAGATIDEILEEFPYLEREDVLESLRYAAWLASEREIRLDEAA